MLSKKEINVFWFKRDLRLLDNEGLQNAIDSGLPLLLVYIIEPSVEKNPHYHNRHHNFIAQSLEELNDKLKKYNTKVHVYKAEVLEVLNNIKSYMKISCLFSMQETGLNLTYQRDKGVKEWCCLNGVTWKEHTNNGVTRGIKNRNVWRKTWTSYMMQPIKPFKASTACFTRVDNIDLVQEILKPKN